MAVYQLFVKLLDGRTQCFQVSAPTISGETLKNYVFAKTRIPLPFQRLITGSRIVSDETLISAADDGLFPSCVLLLRLPGGKGGFGSLLRGAATKAGQKKTNNFDACRDMSGRRLRHVNAEKKLEEWKSEAEDRRLEKLAEQFLKKKAKENKKNSSVDVNKYLEKYREDSAKCMEEVDESVRNSFEVYKDLKRKNRPAFNTSSKRLKIWMGKSKVEESCSDDDDDDNNDNEEKSVVLDDGSFRRNFKEIKGSSSMLSGSCVGSEGETSGTSDQSKLGQAKGSMLDDGSSGNASEQSSLEELHENFEILFPAVDQSFHDKENNFEAVVSSVIEAVVPESIVLSDATLNVMKVSEKDELKPGLHSEMESDPCDGIVAHDTDNSSLEEPLNFHSYNSATELEVPEKDELKLGLHSEMESDLRDGTVAHDTDNSNLEEPLNFDNYNSASELEAIGMERLKAELQARGLKCGGTLSERASRLYLLKTTTLDKLPKKFLSKPAK